MNDWTNTYMFGVAVLGYLATFVALMYCLQYFSGMIKRAIPDKRKRNNIENCILKCLVVCWLLTSFFGISVFFSSLACMLLIMIAVLFLFDDTSTR